ncbi:hypothetical protein BS17DRAFT_231481 [Gyrodon lividus]|nr:hypothetical protein BS17DRAFT_231481 [Gyrodon lividus]
MFYHSLRIEQLQSGWLEFTLVTSAAVSKHERIHDHVTNLSSALFALLSNLMRDIDTQPSVIMEANIAIQLTQTDVWTSQDIDIPVTSVGIDHEDKLGTVAQVNNSQSDSSGPNCSSVLSSLCPTMHDSDIKADDTGGQSSQLKSKDCGSAFYFVPDKKLSNVQNVATSQGDRVDRIPNCAPSSNDEKAPPAPSPIADAQCNVVIPADAHTLVVLRGHPERAKSIPNFGRACIKTSPERIDPLQEAVSPHPRSACTVATEPGEGQVCSTDNSDYVQTLRAVLNSSNNNICLAHYSHVHHEAKAVDADYPGELFPSSSIPPSSSPPQLFPSSPFASSQSSLGGIDDKTQRQETINVEEEDRTPYEVTIPSESEDEHHYPFKGLSGENRMIEHGPMSLDVHRGKRVLIEDHDLTTGAQTDGMHVPGLSPPPKRAKPSAEVYLPPAPKRATVASQRSQFKKLIAPFRSPLRLPAVVDGSSQAANKNNQDRKESAIHISTSQRKSIAVGTSRAAAQFKSPLIDFGTALTDSRGTIRLTPMIQTLERKLQLLKRAVKVKENNEDEVLTKLAKKWTEAGREVAYEIWDIVRDAGNTVDGATSFSGSWGWEGADNRDTKWGWDTKSTDASRELCDYDPPEAPCATKQPVVEEEVDECTRTNLATMLRQLGIIPDTLGWDDDREHFID